MTFPGRLAVAHWRRQPWRISRPEPNYFVVLQVCLFVTVRSRNNSIALAWVVIAILLSAMTHFVIAGGI
jgi:hypothetical protein